MNKYEVPIMVCTRFSKQDIITTSTAATDAVAEQLNKAGVDSTYVQTVKWNTEKVSEIISYK